MGCGSEGFQGFVREEPVEDANCLLTVELNRAGHMVDWVESHIRPYNLLKLL